MQNSIGKRPKDFESSGFPSGILDNTHFFFLNQSQKSKRFHNIDKSGDVQETKWSMQKILFCYENFAYPSQQRKYLSLSHKQDYQRSTLNTYLCYRQTKWYMQKIPSVTGIVCGKCQIYNI